MARRWLDFLAGAAVGAAVTAYLKSDRERLASLLDKAEAALTAGEEPSPKTEVEHDNTEEEQQ